MTTNTYILWHTARPIATVTTTPGQSTAAVKDLAAKQLAAGKLQHDDGISPEQLTQMLGQASVTVYLEGLDFGAQSH